MRQQLFSKIPEEIVLYYFEKISRIPRGSGNEKEISDYLFKWASGHGLDAFQDEQNSLIIKKAASRGCKNAEPVILQAHMDMVCEKNADSTHDFSKDPIT
ncbi:MAG: aminoacyl-histidine dipeptidase, partial [Clostridia bacterium]|nr:aminoacyl-histidine dipeptidase [Clostridia bacterium]